MLDQVLMRTFLDLTKSGIVCFVLVSGLAGYALSMFPFAPWDLTHLAATLCTLYFFSAGSFALNQAQEWRIDFEMPRTQGRPIPSGKITPLQATILGVGFLVLGAGAALLVNETVFYLSVATVV